MQLMAMMKEHINDIRAPVDIQSGIRLKMEQIGLEEKH